MDHLGSPHQEGCSNQNEHRINQKSAIFKKRFEKQEQSFGFSKNFGPKLEHKQGSKCKVVKGTSSVPSPHLNISHVLMGVRGERTKDSRREREKSKGEVHFISTLRIIYSKLNYYT